ncbi:MAG TPA: hypothetical protein VEU51_02110, partial [Candidatus Acidoferrales bacterium]|nr:hypothetical protein [Candidatus Acidoferrales bacterium]
IAAVFSGNGAKHTVAAESIPQRARVVVNRAPRPLVVKREIGAAASVAAPGRVGIEFYDPAARIGAMASFDVGGAGMGARIMMLFDGHHAALFTAEGRPTRSARGVNHGPLSLARDGNSIVLSFRGPAVIVPDATAYLSIERALASGRLDGAMNVSIRVELNETAACGGFDFDRILSTSADASPGPDSSAAFGRSIGEIEIEGAARAVNGFARAGMSFTGLGPQKFIARRMVWASFDGDPAPDAIEARSLEVDGAPPVLSARRLEASGWVDCELSELAIDTNSVEEPPHRIAASLRRADGTSLDLRGRVDCFIPLSRPGPENSRIYTSLGFAKFQAGARIGAGMFEFSRRADSVLTTIDDADDSDSD